MMSLNARQDSRTQADERECLVETARGSHSTQTAPIRTCAQCLSFQDVYVLKASAVCVLATDRKSVV